MQNELKPCPFCGGKVQLNKINHRSLNSRDFWFICNECGVYIMLPVNSKYINVTETEKEATNMWNRRVCNDRQRKAD